jgi:hypothetical protein
MKTDLVIKEKIEGGKTATLTLTKEEVQTGVSVCDFNGVEVVTVMKKHNGAAMFFANPGCGMAAQYRHKFDYSFDIKAEDLAAHLTKIAPMRPPASTASWAATQSSSG